MMQQTRKTFLLEGDFNTILELEMFPKYTHAPASRLE